MGFFSWLFKGKSKKNKVVVGLALGSGGAKGFSELGVIAALEEEGIYPDCVAGTSIGAIIGAYIANGYSSSDIENLLKTLDFKGLTGAFMVNMDTSWIIDTVKKTLGDIDIKELKKPFVAVTTELETGDEKAFYEGKVASALAASGSYPPFFKPVVIDGKRYIDGAFCNSVPSDHVKNLGANFVIAVDLKDHEENADKKGGFLDKLFPTYQGKVEKPWQKGYENANIVIHPDLKGYKSTSFSAGTKMYELGYLAAKEKMPEIKAGIEKLRNKK